MTFVPIGKLRKNPTSAVTSPNISERLLSAVHTHGSYRIIVMKPMSIWNW